ncbi:Uncharacterized protein Rs2_07219 [Raphanus sativus]|nr:Uncharacterized protein Rs2_07219 [Raphanus sativus]
MAQEEEQLLKLREDEEKAKGAASGEALDMNDTQFTKLDELLTQTQLFLLEKMEDITKESFKNEKKIATLDCGQKYHAQRLEKELIVKNIYLSVNEALAMKKINV